MTDYPRDFGQQVGLHSGLPRDLEARAQRLEHPMNETTTTTTDVTDATELTLESMGPGIVEYLDLGLKALLVIAAFAVAAQLS